MIRRREIQGSVLPMVLVISVLMMLLVLGLMALWEFNSQMFSRNDYVRKQTANIDSFITLFMKHPDPVGDKMRTDSVFRLYAGDEGSSVNASLEPWGLYEVLTVKSLCGKVGRTVFLGLECAYGDENKVLWYRNHGSALTITGRTDIIGPAAVPSNGIIYGQMQSVFFSGTEVNSAMLTASDRTFPEGHETAAAVVKTLFDPGDIEFPTEQRERWEVPFSAAEPVRIDPGTSVLTSGKYSGKIVLYGNSITVREGCDLHNVILAADHIKIEDGVKGVFQAFARDSVTVGNDVVMDFPSGVYSENRIRIGDRAEINGYVVNNYGGETVIMVPNTVKAKTARVRGLFYSRGISQVQGIQTGSSFIQESVFYAPHGYYRNFLYEASFLESDDVAYPLWLARDSKRKAVGWID